MSDSFADLWSSSAPAKPTPQKLGTPFSQTNSTAPRRPANDVFSLLAAPSQQPSRTQTPKSPPAIAKSASQTTTRSNAPGGADAFSSLLSGSIGTGFGGGGATMTIAERAAMATRQRQQEAQKQQQAAQTQAAAWAGLDSLGSSSPSLSLAPSKPASASPPVDEWDFAGLGAVTAAKPSPIPAAPPKASTLDDDDWGLADFSSAKPTASGSANGQSNGRGGNAKSSQSIWDMDEFASAPAARSRSDSLGDFDFGNREDRLMAGDESDEDDILGELSKPTDSVAARSSPQVSSLPPALNAKVTKERVQNGSNGPKSANGSRAVSPPPHIIGQIVEMGFSPQQARVALAATETGLDVQAALETLLSNGAGGHESSRREPSPRQPERRRPTEQRSRGEPGSSRDPRPRRDAPREQRRGQEQQEQPRDTSSPSAQQDLNAQAEKILAQASDFGMNVFNRANAFWKESREKAQKLYEERQVAGAKAAPPKDGRPRWMQEVQDGEGEGRERERRKPAPREQGRDAAGFKDGDEVLPPKPSRRKQLEPEQQQPSSQPPHNVDLLSSESPAAYVSPWRRGRPKQSAEPTPSSSSSARPTRAPSPIRLTTRQTVSASQSAIASSAKHKAAGTEKYKLGQYADAESAYSLAIDALPATHLLLVPLLNNRAIARIKTGDSSGAIDDCTTTIGIIGASYSPVHEAKVERVEDGAGVDIGDGLVKALKRRAEAYEAREKWDLAQKDWETVAGFGWGSSTTRNEGVRGAGRCRKTLAASSAGGGGDASSSSVPQPPKPKPRLVPAARRPPAQAPKVAPSNSALNKLREANNAAEAEDEQRHQLKDSVDARLLAWKGGKETNIRALMGSLDTVLWPELGMPKVGMAELVTPAQVKIRYMKAIARLHPDKLNASNTTVEQRMIANGVFGALNEAWNAFQ
ncbi:hypothetical protein CONPUDRAFT_159811 [Coniophora puteana RWD-64-598 SS2]|uniref:UBA domain-containing protein n=1 Tax=Coniophora puteana (strain RWD-64-598) TaxID=741705 RepID=R7SF52_CONPW|nr:uncharacterized protein CONPUDRAFT_159811 [Coniophora puteana RWD-64-598 SS2]EIW74510.1 hypothetical protein CONPUDRAFT_159811 [Coniophora puteana RWD-64-598 SS2]